MKTNTLLRFFVFNVLALFTFGNIANAQTGNVKVDARASIFGAGNSGLPEGSIAPIAININPGINRALFFLSITGLNNLQGHTPNHGPDGGNYGTATNVSAFGGISGVVDNDIANTGALFGVFTSNAQYGVPPANLDITGAKNHTFYKPQLNQVFFIGDGLTGTETGTVQTFFVPDAATNLYPGIVDGNPINNSIPRGYGDNIGSFMASYSIVSAPASVFGSLTLDDIAPNAAAQNVTFTLRATDGSPDITQTAAVPASGAFILSRLPAKQYTLHIKGDKYLAANVSVDTTNGDVSGITAMLGAGDGNNDNSVDSSDFTLLIGAYNSDATVPGNGYNPAADFNSDVSVDSTDFTLLIGQFNNIGDL